VRNRVRLRGPLPCEGCGLPADFAEVDGEGDAWPWHDLCAVRVDGLAASIVAARDCRLGATR